MPQALSILIVIGDLETGGTQRHLSLVLPQLVRRGFRITVVTLTHEGWFAEPIKAGGVIVVPPPFADRARSWPRIFRRLLLAPVSIVNVWLQIMRRGPDICHFFLPTAINIGACCAIVAGRPIRIASRRAVNTYQQRRPIRGWLERRLYRGLTAVLANANALCEELLREGVPPSRLALLPNGIETVPEESTAKNRQATRAALGLSEDAFVMVCVANYIPHKAHDTLLQALTMADANLPDTWQVLCVGRDTGIGALLREQSDALGLTERVLWLGERRDVPAILAASDLGLLCSREEGTPNAVLEAMSTGLAMVVSDIAGNAEAVRNERDGLVVPVDDPEAAAAAIVELAGDPARRHRMGESGRARVREDFSLEVCVDRYARLYTGLFAQPNQDLQALIDGNSQYGDTLSEASSDRAPG